MKLYHISPNPRLTTLIPKKPKNGWVEYGIEDKEWIKNTLANRLANYYSRH